MLWVTIGNGMRYGSTYLRVATAMGCLAFLCTVMLSPYWRSHDYLGWGLLLGLGAIPLYFDSLLHALTRAVAEARQANEAKSRFLANMSHEFRTPLNGLAGMTVLATTRLDDEQRECLNTIQASTRSLLALVEEVLDISTIEAGKVRGVARVRTGRRAAGDQPDPDPADPLQVAGLSRAGGRQRAAAPAGDAGHLQQILLNLMGNAVKFTDSGYVHLRVSSPDAPGSQRMRLRFEIVDTGIGVPVALRGRLFNAFEQGDVGLARRHEGTGLGTAIAKGLVESMGGQVGYVPNSRAAACSGSRSRWTSQRPHQPRRFRPRWLKPAMSSRFPTPSCAIVHGCAACGSWWPTITRPTAWCCSGCWRRPATRSPASTAAPKCSMRWSRPVTTQRSSTCTCPA